MMFHATTKTNFSSQEVARVTHPDLQPGETDSWSGGRLVLPPLPPSFLLGCGIIDIDYYLEVRGEKYPCIIQLDLKCKEYPF